MMQALQTTCDEGHAGEPQTSATDAAPTPEATPAKQEEGTLPAALAPLAEEVIEGEVTAILEPEHKLAPKQPPYYLIVVVTIAGCLLFTLVSFFLPLLTPSATITILPVEKPVSMITTIRVYGRQVAPLTLAQSQIVPATGKRHQAATQAQGRITFFNGLYSSQTVASGTVLTGADGVQIITNGPALIPAANPPYIGQVTISAHAMRVGEVGNIAAGDMNQPCCLTAVKAVNTTAFTGGQNARDVLVVTKHDLDAATGAIKTTLLNSENAVLQAQLNHGEDVIPPLCTPHVSSDHKIGEEAKQVSVTVSVTCSGIAYDAHSAYMDATQMLAAEAAKRFGTRYSLRGDTQVTIIHATITDQPRGIAMLAVKLDATYMYQLSPGEKRYLVQLIAGKTPQQAHALLSQVPGIAGVVITINGNAATLPDEPGKITIVIAERG